MKKKTLMMLILCMASILCACSSQTSTEETVTEEQMTTEKAVIETESVKKMTEIATSADQILSATETIQQFSLSATELLDMYTDIADILTEFYKPDDPDSISVSVNQVIELEAKFKDYLRIVDEYISDLKQKTPDDSYKSDYEMLIREEEEFRDILSKGANLDSNGDGEYESKEVTEALDFFKDEFSDYIHNLGEFKDFIELYYNDNSGNSESLHDDQYNQTEEIETTNNEHTCAADGCEKNGIYELVGFSGEYEYYCYEHYKELENIVNDLLEDTYSTSDEFTNKTGTSTTKCAHPGCNSYIASSGDTCYCTTHSRRCGVCGCYIDEDAMYCPTCIIDAFTQQ